MPVIGGGGGGGGAGQEEEKKPGDQSAHMNLKVKGQGTNGAEGIKGIDAEEEKLCIFRNSDLIYIAYHDEERGVPGHDDKLLFEYLVLSGAQVGSDWTQIANKRENFKWVFGFRCEVRIQSAGQVHFVIARTGKEVNKIIGTEKNQQQED
ncbi:methyladenine glycosylase family protein [Tripterygium wilfordii]|uniref:Methyladenine glycosylase family protein n=1 Tax=Tripterygium wilfordii TaxID=458696 RepID=A0A7J7D620_TRIWF|nr:methyladenine glycosylase family protein [Tripterygium wilfordii]